MKKLLAPLAATALIAACFASTAGASTFYAPLYSTDQIAGFNKGPDGSLTTLGGSPYSLPAGGLLGFAMTPDGDRAVSAYLNSAASARGLNVAADGSISPAQALVGTKQATSVAVTPNGQFAIVPTRNGSTGIDVYAIAADGTLALVGGSPFNAGSIYWDIAVSPDGKYLFAGGGGVIQRFSIASTGVLSPLGTTPISGSLFMQISPTGQFLFAMSEPGVADQLLSFSIGADGSLTQMGAGVPVGGVSSHIFGISADGSYLYVPEANSDALYTVRVAPDGTLSTVGSPLPFTDGQSAFVTPDGFLYVMQSGGASSIMISRLGADGAPTGFTVAAPYDPGEPERFVLRPGQGTVAEFKTATGASPLAASFDGAATAAVRGSVSRYSWDFGDGVTATGPAAEHKFAKPGVYNVSLTALDDTGCGSTLIYTGLSTTCKGEPRSIKTIAYDTPPWITAMKLSPRRVGRKTKIVYTLTEAARVTFTVQRPTKGRLVGGKCRSATRKNRTAKRCTLWKRAAKSFRANAKSGSNKLKFVGKVGRKQLAAGKYRLNAIAKDTQGASPQRTANFRIPR